MWEKIEAGQRIKAMTLLKNIHDAPDAYFSGGGAQADKLLYNIYHQTKPYADYVAYKAEGKN